MMKTDINFGHEYHLLRLKKRLEEKIARELNVKDLQVQLTNGSNGSLEYVTSRFAIHHFNTTGSCPTAVIDYPNYFDTIKFLESSNYTVIKIPRKNDFLFPLEQMLYELKKYNPTLVILTTPNNPTGIPILDEELCTIIKELPNDSTAIVDRTCVNIDKELPTSELMAQFPNKKLVVLHSFSKSHNLSAQRIGFFVNNNIEQANYLRLSEDDGRVSYEAMKALKEVIDNQDIVEENKAKIKRSIELLSQTQSRYPEFTFTATKSNFALVKIFEELQSELEQKFEFVRGREYGYTQYCRVNISDDKKLEQFIRKYANLKKRK